MFGPLSHVFTSADAVCVSQVCWNMLQNFGTKNLSGIAKILLSSLKILARLGATFVKSTAGISNALFVFNGDS